MTEIGLAFIIGFMIGLVIAPRVLRRAPCRYGLRKRPFAASCAAFPAAVKAAQLIAGPLFTKWSSP